MEELKAEIMKIGLALNRMALGMGDLTFKKMQPDLNEIQDRLVAVVESPVLKEASESFMNGYNSGLEVAAGIAKEYADQINAMRVGENDTE